MNGEICCVLGVCCPPESAGQVRALANEMAKDWEIGPEAAQKYARWVLKHFDLAPAGTLSAFKGQLAEMVRKHQ